MLLRARRLLADAAGLRDELDLSVIKTVARLATEYPRLQFEIIEGHWRDFAPRLLNAEVELAVVELSIVAKDPRFQVEPLPIAAARAIIKRTNGIGIAAPVQLAEDLRLGAVAIIDAGAGVLQSSYGIALLRGKVLSPGAQAFVSRLKVLEAEMQSDTRGANKSARAPARLRRNR